MAQLGVDPDLTGVASSLVIGIRSYGAIIGASAASAIFTAKITDKLPSAIAGAALAAGVAPADLVAVITAVATGNAGPVSVAGVTAAQIAAAQQGRLEAFAASFAYIYYFIMPFCVAGIVCEWDLVAVVCLFTGHSVLWFLESPEDQMNWSIT